MTEMMEVIQVGEAKSDIGYRLSREDRGDREDKGNRGEAMEKRGVLTPTRSTCRMVFCELNSISARRGAISWDHNEISSQIILIGAIIVHSNIIPALP